MIAVCVSLLCPLLFFLILKEEATQNDKSGTQKQSITVRARRYHRLTLLAPLLFFLVLKKRSQTKP